MGPITARVWSLTSRTLIPLLLQDDKESLFHPFTSAIILDILWLPLYPYENTLVFIYGGGDGDLQQQDGEPDRRGESPADPVLGRAGFYPAVGEARGGARHQAPLLLLRPRPAQGGEGPYGLRAQPAEDPALPLLPQALFSRERAAVELAPLSHRRRKTLRPHQR